MNAWIIIFLCTAANGLFLSIALFFRKEARSSVLAAFILSFTLLLVYYVLFWSRLTAELPRSVGLTFGFTYLLGPLLYFYLRFNTAKRISWHFTPFVLFVAYFFLTPLVGRDSPVHLAQVLLQIGHILAYGVILVHHSLRHDSDISAAALKFHDWQKWISAAFLGYGLSYLTYYVMVWTGILKVEYDYMISLASAVLIYYVGVQGFRDPNLISKSSPSRYGNSGLTHAARLAILRKVKEYFDLERPFLDSDVSLVSVSEATEIPRHHISEAINYLESMNFPEFLTRYRLEEAERILRNPLEAKTKIIDVAYRSGFNNKVSFYQAFRKHLGTSPATYREEHQLALSN